MNKMKLMKKLKLIIKIKINFFHHKINLKLFKIIFQIRIYFKKKTSIFYKILLINPTYKNNRKMMMM
jgi:hypothetical protein